MNDERVALGVPRLLTVEEAAKRLHLGRSTAWVLVGSGALPSLTIGRARRVSESALTHFIEQREADARPQLDNGMADSDLPSESAAEAGHDATDLRG